MQIIKNPSEEQLSQLQNVLSREANAGIGDIFGVQVSHYLAMEDAGSLVGVASISVHGAESAELYKLYVVPSCRTKGIGKQLFDETIRFLNQENLTELFIEMEGESRPFWESVVSNHKIQWYDDHKFGVAING